MKKLNKNLTKQKIAMSVAVASCLFFTGCVGGGGGGSTSSTPSLPETPVIENPIIEDPIIENPVDETPVDETPVDETPVDETPVDETPVDETPVDETPVDETPVDETPVDETPVDETPVDETPVDETPVDETPVDETPVIETPTEKWLTNEYNASKLNLLGVNTAYESGFTGEGVTVAVIDSGFNYNHQEFLGKTVLSKSFNKFTNGSYDSSGLNIGQIEDITFELSSTTYGSTPTVTIQGDGVGATAVAILDGDGQISEIQMTNHGTGYTNATVYINGVEISEYNANLAMVDTDNHGTGVGSVIAGNKDMEDVDDTYNSDMQGVAYNADILAVKIFDNNIVKPSGSVNMMNDGIDWAVNNGANILNLSLGTANSAGINFSTTIDTFRNALDNNASVVIASGNSGLDCKESGGTLDGNCSFPAALPWLSGNEDLLERAGGWVVVGAVKDNNEMVWFSNKAGVMASNYIVAPGTNIYVATGDEGTDDYRTTSGTSFAAPYVSGAMALMYERFPHLDGNQMAQIFFDTATDLGDPGIDEVYGNGLINVEAAFQPIGDLTIPVSKNTNSGLNTSSLYSTGMVSTKAFGNALLNVQSLDNTIALDSYKRDYNFALSKSIVSTTDSDSDDSFSFDNLKLFEKKGFIVGLNEKEEFALGYKVNDNFRFLVSQENDLYGLESSGAFGLNSEKTSYFQAALKTELSTNVVLSSTLEYGIGTAKSNSGSMISDISSVNSIGGKIALEYNDSWGFSLEVPRRIVSGKMNFNIPTGRSGDTVNFEKASASLSPDATEQTFRIYKKYSNKNFSLLSSIGRTENKDHLSGKTGESVYVNLKYVF